MIAELYGKSTGCCKGRGGSMHLADSGVNFLGTSAIVGNSIPVGVGVALAQKLQGTNSRVFVFLGDAAAEEGVFYESISFAAIHNLSVIFICENNGFSVYSDFLERQPNGREIFEMVQAMGVKSSKIDGMNPIESFAALQNAIAYVENNNSPFFLEVTNHRFLEHCGPNDDSDLGYRPSNYSDLAKQNDPVVQLERYLRDAFVDDAFFVGIRKEIDLEIGKAFEFATQSPLAKEELSEEDVFSK
jgi:pyruvate dehydrogenase E1 component alpha subunit